MNFCTYCGKSLATSETLCDCCRNSTMTTNTNQPDRAALGAVDEAMVERALRSFWSKEIEMGLEAKVFCAESRNDMRAALEAALASRHLAAIDHDAQSDATQ